MNVTRVWHDGRDILDRIIEQDFVQKSGRFLGVGANIGKDWAWPLACNGWHGVYVEPDPSACSQLVKNCKPFGDRIQIVNCAVSGTGGLQSFFCSLKSNYNSSLNKKWLDKFVMLNHSKDNDDAEHIYPILTNTISFTDLISHIGKDFTCIVIDTEGTDEEIVKSVDWSKFTNCELVCIEHEFMEIEPHLSVISYLHECGFEFTDQDNCHAIYRRIN